jgi:outer membrane protein with glycine zipper
MEDVMKLDLRKVGPAVVLAGAFLIGGCSEPLSTREKAAGIGALGGAAVGAGVGAAVGHPGAGAAIGGALGLGGGALVGDQMQRREDDEYYYNRR